MTAVNALKVVVTGDSANLKKALSESRAEVASLAAEAERFNEKMKGFGSGPIAGPNPAAIPAMKDWPSHTDRGAKATALAAHEVTNLTYQVNDLAMALATGQPAFVAIVQQGAQFNQIMGQRGLSSILPAIATGITSLISPTTLLLAGMTALGYGASAVFTAMRGEVRSTDDVLKEHEAMIGRINDAYGEAGKGVKAYADESRAVLAFLARSSAEETRTALRAATAAALDELGSMTYSGFRATRANMPFNEAIKELHASALEGEPDVRRFLETVAKLAEQDKTNEKLQTVANSIFKVTSEADRLARALPQTDAALTASGNSAGEAAKQFEKYKDALEVLSKIKQADVTDRDQALSGLRSGMASAQDASERLRILKDYDAALRRIQSAEDVASQRIPIPTPRPLDLERVDKQAEAFQRLSSGQSESLAKTQMEIALIGASSDMRQRMISLMEVERQIRAAGLDVRSAEAEAIRDQAEAMAEATLELERQQGAWNTVQTTGERAIDGLVSKLSAGDIEGALKGLGDDIMKMSLELAVSNPIKNALFGTNKGTLADVMQGGLFGRMAGRGDKEAQAGALNAISSLSSIGSMDVTAASVVINAAGLSGNLPGLGGGIGGGLASGLSGGNVPANDNSVAGQIWKFFQSKGLKDFQIAGIVGNVKAESNFNPLAVGDGGNAFGLFQHNDRRHALFDFIGGKGNLGNVQKQLEFAWHELQTSESGAFKKLMASGNVLEATKAFGAFERPSGYSPQNPEAMHNFTGRLMGAQQALDKFGGTTADATNATAGFGKGLTSAISSLASAGQGAVPGLGALTGGGIAANAPAAPSLAGSILSGFDNFIGSLFGFDSGGWTGDGHPADIAGVTHKEEYVVRAGPARKFRPLLEAMNQSRMPGYDKGGFVTGFGGSGMTGSSMPQASGSSSAPVIQIIDNAGVSKRTETERDGNGTDIIRVVLDRVGSELGAGRYDGAMSGRFGARPVKVMR